VIFVPDQWRADVMGHHGNPGAVTPHLDRAVATDHVSFSSAFCQNPVCTPSRCSFMSGWYPHVRGHRTMFHMMKPDEPVLLRTLKQEGYYVWWGGKNDLIPGQSSMADYCDVYYRPSAPPGPLWPDGATYRGEPADDAYYSFYVGELDMQGGVEHRNDPEWAWIQGAIDLIQSPPTDQPLCIYLPLVFPHPPYGVEEPYFSAIDRDALPPRAMPPESWEDMPAIVGAIHERQGLGDWAEERWTELRAVYYAMCTRMDHMYGLVCEALREAGMYDDTALFFFADHGDFTGDYGLVEKTQNTFQDCLVNVPLLVKPPRNVPIQPRVSDALVELIDVPATIEDLLGIVPTHTHFGRSLLPVIAGEEEDHRDAVFCEGGRLPGELQAMELESVSSQTADGAYWPRLSIQRADGPEHGKGTMCRTSRFKYVRRLLERDELYDLRSDPWERENRIDDPGLSDVAAGLRDRMLTFYQETCDVVPVVPDDR
jgi:arylsulfatase A-like enzyme